MTMNEININHDELKKYGIVKVKNFLTNDELKILKDILGSKLEKKPSKKLFFKQFEIFII